VQSLISYIVYITSFNNLDLLTVRIKIQTRTLIYVCYNGQANHKNYIGRLSN